MQTNNIDNLHRRLCRDCKATGPVGLSESEANDFWNSRPVDLVPTELAASLEEVLYEWRLGKPVCQDGALEKCMCHTCMKNRAEQALAHYRKG